MATTVKPRDLERVLTISQPKVSDLLNGKNSSMTLDRLTKYLHRLGREVKVRTVKLPNSEVALRMFLPPICVIHSTGIAQGLGLLS